MKNLCISAYAKMMSMLHAFRSEERGAVDIVAIVVMIGIAVVVAVVFKGAIINLVNNLFDKIGKSAETAISS